MQNELHIEQIEVICFLLLNMRMKFITPKKMNDNPIPIKIAADSFCKSKNFGVNAIWTIPSNTRIDDVM